MASLQAFALYIVRALGGFSLAQRLTRRRLRILCYHGFSVRDEHELAPVMFMRPETFERRLRILRKRRIPVIPLDQAVSRLEEGSIENAETVITFDDGWASTLTVGQPMLEKYGYAACVYVTTEHLAASPEAFNVALAYLMWRSPKSSLILSGIHPQLDGVYALGTEREKSRVALIQAAEWAFPLEERQKLLRPIAEALGVSLEEVLTENRFRFLTSGEMQELARRGMDVQLHSHTHRLPDHDFAAVAREIEANREALKEVVGMERRHFCYPSGAYAAHHPQWLRSLGIVSATTCDPGHNKSGTSLMQLRRYLDSDRTSDLFFEAEVCGVRDLLREARARVRI